MSLRTKIALTVFMVAASFVALDHWLQDMRFTARFASVDRERSQAAVESFREEFAAVIDVFAQAATELAVRNREDGSTARRGSDDPLLVDVAESSELDLVLGLDALGGVIALRLTDAQGLPLTVRELPNEQLSLQHELLQTWCGPQVELLDAGTAERLEGRPPRGLWSTEAGQLVVAGIEHTDPTGEVTRWIAGRWLDDELLRDLQARSGATIEVHPLLPGTRTPAEQQALDALARGEGPVIEVATDAGTQAWAALEDVGERPAMLIESYSTNRLEGIWADLSRDSLLSAVGMVILFPLAILMLLQGIVTGPLLRLSRQVVRIGQEDDVEARLGLERGDEIGQLADEFDDLLAKLEASRAELVRTARLAGMSEISAGTLHNVGNVLNSVNVAAKLCRDAFQRIDAGPLRVVLESLQENRGRLDEFLENDPRGSMLLPAFEAMLARIEQACARGERESVALEEDVDKVASLISSLERADARVQLSERFRLEQAIEATLELCLQSVELPALEVERGCSDLGQVRLDQHRLRDLLMQLVLNALQSLRDAAPAVPRLRVACSLDGLGRIRIEVADNGLGIDPGDQESIFRLGVTTKAGGKGLGLHLAATTAVELGGQLACESAGLGEGATFVLTLPGEVLVSAAA